MFVFFSTQTLTQTHSTPSAEVAAAAAAECWSRRHSRAFVVRNVSAWKKTCVYDGVIVRGSQNRKSRAEEELFGAFGYSGSGIGSHRVL